MYDALHISCQHSQVDLPKHLDSKNILYKESSTRKGFPDYSFYMKNLYITSRADYLNIKGSISHYTQGNNIHPLAMNKIKPAIDNLSNDLGANIHLGRVTLFEASDSYVVKNNVGQYLDMLLSWDGKEPQYMNIGTKSFGTTTKMKFYDKGKQILSEGGILPEQYIGKNLFRAELVRTRGLERRTNGIRKPLLVTELYSEKYIIKICNEFIKNYDLVSKLTKKNGVNIKELNQLVYNSVKAYLNP